MRADEEFTERPPAGPASDSDSPALRESSPSESPAGEAVDKDLDALLADTSRERDEYLELAKRTKADFENFRKRMAGEVQAASLRGKSEVVREVVPVLDDLERAIEAEGLDPEGDSEDALAHGVLLVFRGLREALSRADAELRVVTERINQRERVRRRREEQAQQEALDESSLRRFLERNSA